MKRRFVINPRARGVHPLSLREMKSYFESRDIPFDPITCSDPSTIEKQVGLLIDQGADQIIAVGGDGTLQAAANGFFSGGSLRAPHTCLAVGKAGTGSDYWRTVSDNRKKIEWRETVVHHLVKKVDTGLITTSKREIRFLNMASFGWSADVVARKAMAPRWIPAKLSYLAPTISSLLHRKYHNLKMRVDGQELEGPLLALFVSKGRYGGGGMKFADQVQLDDAHLEILWLKDLSLREILSELPRLFGKGLILQKKIQRLRAKEIEIFDSLALPAEIDGELLKDFGPFRLSVDPKSLPLCLPIGSSL